MMAFLLGSRIAWAGAALAVALTWHYTDKAAAVRGAEKELADRVLIETQKKQLEELKRRARVAEEARRELEVKTAAAEKSAEQLAKELEEYEKTTQVNNACVVDPAIIKRLRQR